MPSPGSCGVLCAIQACAHIIAFLSRHMGSVAGVEGSSGRQVQPFEPFLSSFIGDDMSAPGAITVASSAMPAGAALSALLIVAASVIWGFAAGVFAAEFCAAAFWGRTTIWKSGIVRSNKRKLCLAIHHL